MNPKEKRASIKAKGNSNGKLSNKKRGSVHIKSENSMKKNKVATDETKSLKSHGDSHNSKDSIRRRASLAAKQNGIDFKAGITDIKTLGFFSSLFIYFRMSCFFLSPFSYKSNSISTVT